MLISGDVKIDVRGLNQVVEKLQEKVARLEELHKDVPHQEEDKPWEKWERFNLGTRRWEKATKGSWIRTDYHWSPQGAKKVQFPTSDLNDKNYEYYIKFNTPKNDVCDNYMSIFRKKKEDDE